MWWRMGHRRSTRPCSQDSTSMSPHSPYMLDISWLRSLIHPTPLATTGACWPYRLGFRTYCQGSTSRRQHPSARRMELWRFGHAIPMRRYAPFMTNSFSWNETMSSTRCSLWLRCSVILHWMTKLLRRLEQAARHHSNLSCLQHSTHFQRMGHFKLYQHMMRQVWHLALLLLQHHLLMTHHHTMLTSQ